jgi:hypothetical protein
VASEPRPLRAVWQEAEAEALDVLSEQVEHAILSIKRIEGKYANRPELRDAARAFVDLFGTEVENLRRQADMLRKSVAQDARA